MVEVRRTYTATASREGRWWLIEIPGIGATQARRAADAREQARDLISAVKGIPIDVQHVRVEFALNADLMDDVRRAHDARQKLAAEQSRTAELSRKAAKGLIDSGLTGADTAEVLGVSPQRVSQLLKA